MPMISQKFGVDATGASRTLTNLTKKFDALTTSLTNLKAAGGQHLIPTQPLDDAKKKTEGLIVSWQTMVRVITTQIAIRALNGVIDGLSEATERARELGLAIGEIKTISGGSLGLNTRTLNQDLIDISNRLGEDVSKVAAGVYQTLSNEVVAAADALEFYEKAASLAMATQSDSIEVVDALSSVMNSYNLGVEKTDEVMDVLFKTVQIGRLRMDELGVTLGRVLPLAAEMGIEYSEAAAAMALMTQQGVKLSTATTQYQAILQKLLRPSDAMKRLYEEWGVEDGPQAIKVFGGMAGVLRKLEGDTSGSVAAQGDLLQRVRAITAAMALGVDDGKAFAEAIDQVGNSAGVAAGAIETYRNEQAFKLTQSQNEMKNAWSEMGTTLIPMASYATNVLNNNLKAAGLLIGAATGKYTDAYQALKSVNEQQAALNKNIQKMAEGIKTPEAETLRQLGKDAASYYAELNKYEMRLRKVRDESIKSAGKQLADAHKRVTDAYKDGVKELDKFIDEAREKWKTAAKEIADVRREADDAQLENQLDNAQTAADKLRIIDQAIAQQRVKAFEAAQRTGASQESKDAAIAEAERLQSLIQAAKEIADEAGNRGRVLQLQRDEIKAIKSKEQIIIKNRDATLKVVESVEKVKGSWEEAARSLEELFNRREGLLDKLAGLDLTKNTDKQAADRVGKELQELDKQIENIFAQGRYGAKFLQSLGVDTAFAEVSQGFQAALDKATFNWAREVDRAQAEFSKRVFNIRVAMDPAGRGQAAADALRMQQGQDEGTSTFLDRVQKAGAAVLEKRTQVMKDIQSEQMRIASAETQIETIGRALLTGLQKRQEYAERERSLVEGVVGLQGGLPSIEAEISAQKQAQTATTQELVNLLNQTQQQIQNGKVLSDEELQTIRTKALEMGKTLGLAKDENANLQIALGLLDESNKRRQQINDKAAQLPEKAKLEAVRQYTDQLRFQVEQEKVNEDAAQKAKQAVEGKVSAARQAVSPTQQVSQNYQNAATAADNTAAGTQNTTTALPSAIGLANSLAAAFSKAAEQAERMAKAAAAGGGAAAFHGGAMNKWFASGGLATRGQDKILTALTAGETVVNSKNSRRFFSELNAMNQGSQPVYREQGGPVTNVGDINVTVNGGDSSQQTVREIAHALRREVKRGNIKLR